MDRVGKVSYYNLVNHRMSDHQMFDPDGMKAAMLGVPLGTKVQVQSLKTPSKVIIVTVTDHGPYVGGRIIDLTPGAFKALAGSLDAGVIQVKVTIP